MLRPNERRRSSSSPCKRRNSICSVPGVSLPCFLSHFLSLAAAFPVPTSDLFTLASTYSCESNERPSMRLDVQCRGSAWWLTQKSRRRSRQNRPLEARPKGTQFFLPAQLLVAVHVTRLEVSAGDGHAPVSGGQEAGAVFWTLLSDPSAGLLPLLQVTFLLPSHVSPVTPTRFFAAPIVWALL